MTAISLYVFMAMSTTVPNSEEVAMDTISKFAETYTMVISDEVLRRTSKLGVQLDQDDDYDPLGNGSGVEF